MLLITVLLFCNADVLMCLCLADLSINALCTGNFVLVFESKPALLCTALLNMIRLCALLACGLPLTTQRRIC